MGQAILPAAAFQAAFPLRLPLSAGPAILPSVPGRPMKVYLVGAGPGDPELISVKGRRILQQADAVLFDHLAPDALLSLAPPHAERIYVGKKKADHAFTQEEICAMLVERARRGLNVVRL